VYDHEGGPLGPAGDKWHRTPVSTYAEENWKLLAAQVVREVNNELRTGRSGDELPLQLLLSMGIHA
jgi:hypothetical protein